MRRNKMVISKKSIRKKRKKRLMSRIISSICALFIFMSLVPSITIADEKNNQSESFNQFLSGFTIKDKNGNDVTEENPLVPGEGIDISWKFNISAKQQTELIKHPDKTYILDIPDNLYQIIKESFDKEANKNNWVIVRDSNNLFEYQYKLNKDGKIEVKFIKVNQGGILSGSIGIDVNINTSNVPSEETIEVDIGGEKTSITIKINPFIKVQKKCNKVEGDKIEWSIKVDPPQDTNSLAGVQVKDTVDNNQTIPKGTKFFIGDKDITSSVKISDDGKSFEYTFPDDIDKGSQTITFSSKVNADVFNKEGIDTKLQNDVTATKDDMKDTSTADTHIKPDMIEKSNGSDCKDNNGQLIKDEDGNYMIEYSVIINSNQIYMGDNIKLEDVLPKGTFYKEGSAIISKYNKSNNSYIDEKNIDSLVEKDKKGDSEVITINLNEAIKGLGNTADKYKIVYRIKYNPENMSNLGTPSKDNNNNFIYTLINTATLIRDGNKNQDKSYHKVITGIGVGEGVPIAKNGYAQYGKDLDKLYKDYNLSGGNYILWTIKVGTNNVTYKKKDGNYTFTDTLPEGLKYKENTFKYNSKLVNVDYNEETRTITYSLGKEIIGGRNITFLTEVIDTNSSKEGLEDGYVLNGVGNVNIWGRTRYKNTAKLDEITSDKIVDYDVSKRLSKWGKFDYSTNKITWNIGLNTGNSVYMDSPRIVDVIPEDQDIAVGENGKLEIWYIKSDNKLELIDNESKPWQLESYDETSRKLTIKYVGYDDKKTDDDYITSIQWIRLNTVLNDKGKDKLNNSNTSVQYNNSAYYEADNIKTDGDYNKVTATVNVNKGESVTKYNGGYNSETGLVHWTIKLNQNKEDELLKGAYIKDTLPHGLLLKTDSVRVYYGIMDSNGTIVKDGSKENDGLVDPSNYIFEYKSDESNCFTITFKNSILRGSMYVVEYDTYVTDNNIKNAENRVTFHGQMEKEIGHATSTVSLNINADADATVYSLNLKKVDSSTNKGLDGAQFTITCNNDSGFKYTGKTEHGVLQVAKQIIPNFEYVIKETQAPNGYYKTDKEYTFTATENTIDASKVISNTIKNIARAVKLEKHDDNGNKLEGAEFQIYSKDGTLIDTFREEDEFNGSKVYWYDERVGQNGYSYDKAKLVSDVNGQIVVKGLSAGEYYFVEKKSPSGYIADKETHYNFTLSEELPDGVDPNTSEYFAPISYPVGQNAAINKKIIKDFSFTKISGSIGENQKILPGAEFKLYKLNDGNDVKDHQGFDENLLDTNIWTCINTVTSGDDGIVRFTGLLPGSYRLVESKAPNGYELPQGSWMFNIEDQTGKFTDIQSVGRVPAFEKYNDSYKLKNYKKPFVPITGGRGYAIPSLVGLVMATFATLYILKAKIYKNQIKK